MGEHFDVLIVGAGHGGASAAIALRKYGVEGTVGLLGEEPELPYERPLLSKDYLSGDRPWESVIFHSAESWSDRNVDLLLGQRVTHVDPAAHIVKTNEAAAISYGKLIWATGGTPRQLDCDRRDLTGVYTLRNRADADQVGRELKAVQDVVLVGGGYIGMEAAAVLRKLAKRVTVLEAQNRVLARVAAVPLSRFIEAEHRAHGVDVRLNVRLDKIVGVKGCVTAVRLLDGQEIPAQMVIVGIGIEPAIQPLITAGAECGNGVRVDSRCRTSLPDVFAIGDCTEHRSRHADGNWTRIESVQNATDQGIVAARAIAGNPIEYTSLPWFWSDQYDLKLQTIGLSNGHDDLIMRGSPSARSFTIVYLRNGAVVALDCINAERDYLQGKMLVRKRARPDPKLIADVQTDLRIFVEG